MLFTTSNYNIPSTYQRSFIHEIHTHWYWPKYYSEYSCPWITRANLFSFGGVRYSFPDAWRQTREGEQYSEKYNTSTLLLLFVSATHQHPQNYNVYHTLWTGRLARKIRAYPHQTGEGARMAPKTNRYVEISLAPATSWGWSISESSFACGNHMDITRVCQAFKCPPWQKSWIWYNT